MKTTSFLFVFLFYFVPCHAQVELGLKGGLNLATVRYINVDNSKARLGWNAGALAEIPIQDNLLIRTEVLYSSKGFGFSATGTSSAGTVKLNYITIPMLFGYIPAARTKILVGPEFGFLRKGVTKSRGIRDDVTNFYRNFDIGFDVGVAYDISKAVGLEVRYNYGFKDLVNVVFVNENGDISGQGKNGANRVFQLGLFYMLDK